MCFNTYNIIKKGVIILGMKKIDRLTLQRRIKLYLLEMRNHIGYNMQFKNKIKGGLACCQNAVNKNIYFPYLSST